MNSKRSTGFTLIELMIVVSIVALLAAIGYPNYRQHMLRTHRTEGMSALQQAAARQERFFSNNSTYTVTVADLGISDTSEGGHYAIAMAAGACGDIARCYTLTATAQGAQADDTACTPLTLDSSGNKGPNGCW